jgi:hypothetical protein
MRGLAVSCALDWGLACARLTRAFRSRGVSIVLIDAELCWNILRVFVRVSVT